MTDTSTIAVELHKGAHDTHSNLPIRRAINAAKHPLKATFFDLLEGFLMWRLWINIAWHGLHQRYKRTWIGMGWIGLSFALFIIVKISIFGPLSNKPIEFYAVNLGVGFLAFRFISNSIVGGGSLFVGSQNWIKSEPLPLSVHIYKLVLNNLIIFFFSGVPVVVLCLFFGVINVNFLLSFPIVIAVYAINAAWVATIMGIICARFRDILHFTGTVMQMLYFATPILWVAPETGFRAKVALYNPLTHYISIFREPILSGSVPLQSWLIVGVITVCGLVLTFFTFARSRLKLIFWL